MFGRSTTQRRWWQGCEAVICMPTTTPDIKVKAVRRLGGTVELVGDSYTETQTHAQVQGKPGSSPVQQTPIIHCCMKMPLKTGSRPAVCLLWTYCIVVKPPTALLCLVSWAPHERACPTRARAKRRRSVPLGRTACSWRHTMTRTPSQGRAQSAPRSCGRYRLHCRVRAILGNNTCSARAAEPNNHLSCHPDSVRSCCKAESGALHAARTCIMCSV